MGQIVIASCNCGYKEKFPVGGGRANFRTLCLFPCLCRACNRLVVANLLPMQPKPRTWLDYWSRPTVTKSLPPACPQCQCENIVPYDHPELCEQQGSRIVISWKLASQLDRELRLTDGFYFCSLCDTYQLRFEAGLCWD